jgi:hypothetical protein
MQALKYRPLPTAVAQTARRDFVDSFGHRLHVQPGEPSPCRHCLRIARPDQPLVLLAYRPFAEDHGPYSEMGPIFVHADECEAYAQTDTFPPDFLTRKLVLRAYSREHAIADAVVAEPGEAEAAARTLFEDESINYVHARCVAYGCFNFVIERA